MPEIETPLIASAPRAGISQQDKPMREEGILSYRALDEMVIYDPAESLAATLNPSARVIWDLCDGNRTVLQICESLSDSFDLPCEQLEGEVLRAIDQLCNLKLLRP